MRKNITTCRTYVVTCLSAPLTAIAIMVLRPSLIIHSGARIFLAYGRPFLIEYPRLIIHDVVIFVRDLGCHPNHDSWLSSPSKKAPTL